MFHANTQRLIDYWTTRARDGRAPSRAAIDPGDFRQLAPQSFVAGRERAGACPLRLAGGFVADLHRRDLRGVDALALWSDRDRPRLQAALEEIRRHPAPLVVTAEALTTGPVLELEVLFAPLAATEAGLERYLGLYQPLSLVARLHGRAVHELTVRAMRRSGAANDEASALRLATLDGRRIA